MLVQVDAGVPLVEEHELRGAVRDAGARADALAGRAILGKPDEPDGDVRSRLQRVLRHQPRIERLLARARLENDAPREPAEELVHVGGRVQRKESLAERDPGHVRASG